MSMVCRPWQTILRMPTQEKQPVQHTAAPPLQNDHIRKTLQDRFADKYYGYN
jgi:hypothetical protein